MEKLKVLTFFGIVLITSNTGFSLDIKSDNLKTEERSSIIDVLYQNLLQEKWSEQDSVCFNKVLEILKNAQNSTLWASWVLDSIQLPAGVLYGSKYNLGNYDECMNAPWEHTHPDLRVGTKYCLADVKLTNVEPAKSKQEISPYGSTERYINTATKHARKLNTVTWGVCVPSICSSEAVATFMKVLLRSSALGSIASNPQIKVDDCQIPGKPLEAGLGFKMFFTFIGLLILIAVSSTWYLANKTSIKSNSFGTELAKAFCMNRNTYELVKPSTEDIPMLHGCRAMTAIIIAYSHQIFFIFSGAVANGIEMERDLDLFFFLLHTDIITDTFMVMSGLLLARGLATKQRLENPLSVLWKRYIRLIGPMALLVFYLASVSLYTGSGPVWPRLAAPEQQMCANNWWLSLLMINNYIRSEEMCFITLWYLPADFQLTLVGVALIYIYRADCRLGKFTVATVSVLALLLPAVATYWWRLPATIIYDVATTINIRGNISFNSTYTKGHYRMGSYLVGLAVGTLMAVYKPTLNRKIISKKWSITIFITVFITGLIPYCMGGIFYTREYDPMEAAIYCATNRIVFAVAFGGLVAVCEYGDLPIINALLSWSGWVPLSRLSYGLYLTHPVIILYNVFSVRNPLRYHPIAMLSDSFGTIVLGFIFSLAIWLLVQAPISNLTSYWYRKPAVLTRSKAHEKEVKMNGYSNSVVNGLEKPKSL